MGKFNNLKDKKIVIFFETEEEMKKFLEECDKENIKWLSKAKASDFVPFKEYDKTCINIEGGHLTYAEFDFYKNGGYEIVNYKHLVKVEQEHLVNINRIVRNKETTIIFWNDDTKTIVKLGENQVDSPEMAILWAFFEKNSGLTKTQAHKTMTKLIDNIHNQDKKKIELPKKKDKNFKVGDKVRLLSHGYTFGFDIGKIYQITSILMDNDYNIVISNETGTTGYVNAEDIEKV